jgi:tetratricopeptide (TPR) repeat protein
LTGSGRVLAAAALVAVAVGCKGPLPASLPSAGAPSPEPWVASFRRGEDAFLRTRHADAEREFAAALKSLGEGPETAVQRVLVRERLARVHHVQARHSLAEAEFRALESEARASGNPLLATILGGLAAVLVDEQRFAEALPLLEESRDIRVAALGPRHETVGVSLHNLGDVHRGLGRHELAESCYLEALAIFGASGPGNDGRASITLNGLAKLRRETGRAAESEELHRRAIALSLRVNGPANVNAALFSCDLAELLIRQGRYEEATRLLGDATRWFDESLGPDHPDARRARELLAAIPPAAGGAGNP